MIKSAFRLLNYYMLKLCFATKAFNYIAYKVRTDQTRQPMSPGNTCM